MKKRIYLLSILLLTLFIPFGVNAKHEGLFSGNDVVVDEEVGSTAFSAGNNVSTTSRVDGANFVAGNNVTVSSSQDMLFAAGNNVILEKVETKDAFVAGSQITVKSSIIRDLYAAAGNIKLDSDISRNAYLGGESVIINSKIGGNVDVDASTITIGNNAEITGTLNYPKNATINIAETAKIGEKTTYKTVEKTKKENELAGTILEKVYSYLAMLLIGIVLMLLNKKTFKQIDKIKKDFKVALKTTGIGFVSLVVVPIAAIIIITTIIGVPLGIISLIVYGLLIYLSVIPTAYYLGNIVLKDKIDNKYVVFALSLLVIYILKVIPVIGGLVGFISLLLGLGIYTELIKNKITEK